MTQSSVLFRITPAVLCSIASLFFTTHAVTTSLAPQYAEGIVYEDTNGNGIRDHGEPGVAGVMVSNQREVVLTNEKGYYRLPVEDEMIVFITKPSGYELPLDENNLPLFYYIHQPAGSPELEYPGLKPTGPLPESVDFGLIPSGKQTSFTAVVFGDPQPRDDRELSWYRDGVVSELAAVDADITLVLGDIMYDNLSLFNRYNRIMRTLDMPVFNIIGNHDLNYDAVGNRYARETYKSYYGPTYFSFNYGDVHFIALDNMDYMGRSETGASQYRGYLSDTHLTWLGNNLEHVDENSLIVLLAHIPLYSMDSDGERLNTVNRSALFDLLEDRERVLFLGGHRHLTFHHFLSRESGRSNPAPVHHIATTAACGSWWSGPVNKHGIPVTTQMDGVPNGYHIFEFDGNTYRERYKAAGFDPGYQIRIESPGNSLAAADLHKTDLLVNVFNGNERSVVRFRINNGEWVEMKRLDEQTSPFFVTLLEMHRDTFSSWIRPIPTNHIWRAALPEMEKGINKISVWSRDMYGQEFRQSKLIEVN